MSGERTTIAERVRFLKQAFPRRLAGTNFAYNSLRDLSGTWREVTWFVLMASASGRFTVHQVVFAKPDYNLDEWVDFLQTKGPSIISGEVVAAMNRSTGDQWRVIRPICWVREDRARAVYRTSKLAQRAAERRRPK